MISKLYIYALSLENLNLALQWWTESAECKCFDADSLLLNFRSDQVWESGDFLKLYQFSNVIPHSLGPGSTNQKPKVVTFQKYQFRRWAVLGPPTVDPISVPFQFQRCHTTVPMHSDLEKTSTLLWNMFYHCTALGRRCSTTTALGRRTTNPVSSLWLTKQAGFPN